MNSFRQCVKAARASEEVRPTLFRQGLLQATQQLLLTIPPAGSLDQEISVVADVLQRQKLLATQSLPLRQLTPPVHPRAFFFSSSAKSANKDQQSSSCLLFVSFTLRYKNPKGKVLRKRVKALLDSGSEKNYLNKNIATSWNLPLGDGHPVQLACSGPLLQSHMAISPLTFSSGQSRFTSSFYVLDNLSFQMVLGLEWWRKYHPNLDLKKGIVSGIFADGAAWSLPLANKSQTRGPLNAIQDPPSFCLPDEFKDYAHLFEPSKTVPTPDTASHIFSF